MNFSFGCILLDTYFFGTVISPFRARQPSLPVLLRLDGAPRQDVHELGGGREAPPAADRGLAQGEGRQHAEGTEAEPVQEDLGLQQRVLQR